MSKLKFTEIVLMAISALITAAKSIIKFVSYIKSLKNKPATNAI